ncbi:hypothetical protein DCAR_0520714 [Daucus carota subsp. sativus]|uniref:Uncharacterized protein n=1 Tax=Daucus carota subsp. sativus TaxID=79200 RepID=A0AAF0X6G8_DAUCS|nr:hypothetical protein DCAR_0520714 [Daucus carota subsp. sativus]
MQAGRTWTRVNRSINIFINQTLVSEHCFFKIPRHKSYGIGKAS